MVFLHQVIHDMLGSAEFLNLCRDQKMNLRQVRELLGTIPPDSEAMGNLIKAVMLHKHLQKQKLPRVSEVIDEVIDVSTSPSQSRSMSQPRPKSCAHAGRPARPQASRASPAQPKPAARPKTFAQPIPTQAEPAAGPKTFARPIPGQAHKKCAHPPKGHGKTSCQKGKKEQESETHAQGGKGKKRKAEEQERAASGGLAADDIRRQMKALQRRIDDALRERARDREEGGAEEEEFAEQDHPQQVCGSNQACPKKNLPKPPNHRPPKVIRIPGDI